MRAAAFASSCGLPASFVADRGHPGREALLEREELRQEIPAPVGNEGAPQAQVMGEVAVELDHGALEPAPRLGVDGIGELLLGLDVREVRCDLVE